MRRTLLIVVAAALLTLPALASDLHVVAFSGAPPADFAARVAALGGSVEFTHAGAAVASVSGLTDEAAASLAKSQGVTTVARDAEFTVAPATLGAEDFTFEAPPSAEAPQTAYFYPRQWNMPAIGADQAWAAGFLGKPEVTVAVLDTGIAYTHADLSGRVDLARSISFRNNPGNIDELYRAAYFPSLHPVTDLQYHGTHVAATIASNAVVAAGVTSKVTLMGVKVLSLEGRGNTTYTVRGILHAADNGADVINMSLGGAFAKPGLGPLVAYLNQAIAYAYRKGVLVVVAAGNESTDLDHDGNTYATYCSAPNVVCVSATGPTNDSLTAPWQSVDAFAGYSNFGRSSVSVAAPGGNASVVWAACSNTTVYNLPCRLSPTYALGLSGTSMATPHTAGLAALLVGELGKGKPGLVRARLLQSAVDLGQPGTDPFYGKGRIDVARALGLR